MTKKLINALNYLGKDFSTKTIDLELVIYRNLGNGYDFEISGLNNSKRSFQATVYVWRTSEHMEIIETISDITSLKNLKDVLNSLIKKYICIQD